MQENFAYIYKDGNNGHMQPMLGLGRSGSLDASESTDEYFTFTITQFEEDRDGDVVVPMGCDLTNFSKNPVWHFGHQELMIPIGTSRAPDGRICVFPEENRVQARWYPDYPDPDAAFIAGKVKRGILNATSIAFVPIKAYRRDDVHKAHQHEGGASGWVFEKYDLTEVSIVSVPSNAGAVRDMLDQEKSFIRPRLQKALGAYAAQAKGCWNGWCPTVEKKMTRKSPDNWDAEEARKVFNIINNQYNVDRVRLDHPNTQHSTVEVTVNGKTKYITENSYWQTWQRENAALKKSLTSKKSCGCSTACTCKSKSVRKTATKLKPVISQLQGIKRTIASAGFEYLPGKVDQLITAIEQTHDPVSDAEATRSAWMGGKAVKYITVNGVRYKAIQQGECPLCHEALDTNARQTILITGKCPFCREQLSGMDQRKALGESSGAAGGYAVDEEHKGTGTFHCRDCNFSSENPAQVKLHEELNPTHRIAKSLGKAHRCTFCKGTGSGCGRPGDCPDCGGGGVRRKRLVQKSDARIGKGSDGWWVIENNKKISGPYATEGEAKNILLEYTNPYSEHSLKSVTKEFLPCPKCGKMVSIDDRYCANCKVDLSLDSTWKGKSMRRQRRKAQDDGTEVLSDDHVPADAAPHETAMAHLYNHAKSEMDYVTQALEGITPFDANTGEANAAHGALKEYGESVGARMESLKGMFSDHTEGKDIDEAVKGLEVAETTNPEIGEANLVDRGEVPVIEEDDDSSVEMDITDDGMIDDPSSIEMDDDSALEKGIDDLDKAEDEFAEDHDTAEILERYQMSLKKSLSSSQVRQLLADAGADQIAIAQLTGPLQRVASSEEGMRIANSYKDRIGDLMGLKYGLEDALGKSATWQTRKVTRARVAKVLAAGGRVKRGQDGRKWLVAPVVRKASDSEIAQSWAGTDADDLDSMGLGDNAAVDVASGKVLPWARQDRRTQQLFREMYEDAHGKSLKHGKHKDLTNEGNPAELKSEHADAVKSCGNMLKGLAAAHDMPEHHKSALDMHGDALHKSLDDGDPADAATKACKHMKSLADAPDVPDHHKEALNFHAKAMAKALKDLAPEQAEETKEEEPAEEEKARGNCANCQGTGIVQGDSCELCGGTGKNQDKADDTAEEKAVTKGDNSWKCMYCETTGPIAERPSVCPNCGDTSIVTTNKSKAIDESDAEATKSLFADLRKSRIELNQAARRTGLNGTKK